MKWDAETEENLFSRDVERALEVVRKIKGALENPSGEPVVIYEYPDKKWWRLGRGGKPVTHQIILDPTDQTELTRFQNLAQMFENYSKDPNKHNQIGAVLKRTFEEEK